MFELLLVLSFFKKTFTGNIKNLDVICDLKLSNENYLFHITVDVDNQRFKLENSIFHYNYDCEPSINCAPTEEIRHYATNAKLNRTEVPRERVLIFTSFPFTLELWRETSVEIDIKFEEEEAFLVTFKVQNEEIIKDGKIKDPRFAEVQKKRHAIVSRNSSIDKSQLLGVDLKFESQKFKTDGVKINNGEIVYYETALKQLLKYIPLRFEKESKVETVFLDIKAEHENLKTPSECVFGNRMVKVFGNDFFISFSLKKHKFEILGVTTKSRKLIVMLLTIGTILLLVILIGLWFFFQKNKNKPRKFRENFSK